MYCILRQKILNVLSVTVKFVIPFELKYGFLFNKAEAMTIGTGIKTSGILLKVSLAN